MSADTFGEFAAPSGLLLVGLPQRRRVSSVALAVSAWVLGACSGEAGTNAVGPASGAAGDQSTTTLPDGTTTVAASDGASTTNGAAVTTDAAGTPTSAGTATTSDTTTSTAATDTGVSAGSAGTTVDPDTGATIDCTVLDAAPSVLRRLSRLEYTQTVQQLLQLPAPPDVDALPQDSDLGGFRTVAEHQGVSTQHLRAYSSIAASLSAELMADTPRRTSVLACEVADAGCLESFTTRFGRQAFRRTLTVEEVTGLTSRAATQAISPEDQFQFVIEAVLSSPSFLYRVEVGDAPEGLATLSGVELASKLSFTILGRAPTEELLAQGEQGSLDTPDGLMVAAQSLMAEPAKESFFGEFFKQWLDFEELWTPPTTPVEWSAALLPDMIQESELVFKDFAWGTGVNFLDVLTANYSYVTPQLASFYGLSQAAAGAQRIDFPAGHPRENTGILTHAALISAKGDGDILAHRGKWLRSGFLCESGLEVPTALLDSLGDELEGLTYQQILERRNTEAGCSGCHALIDSAGVGFVQFDKTGHYDSTVQIGDFGITPQLVGSPDPEFASLGELATKLRAREEVASCVADRVFLYTQGREPEAADACAVDAAISRFAGSEYSFSALLQGLVEVPQFRLRRAPSLSEAL